MAPSRVPLGGDPPVLRAALSVALGAAGFAVRAVEDLGSGGVMSGARDFEPQLVLLDFYLAGGDSLPLIQPLVRAGSQVLMLTGAADRPVMGECLEAGAVGIVEKGQPLERVVDTIGRAVRGSSVMRPVERDDLVAR